MAVSGVLGWHNIRGLHIQIDLPDEIYSGLATLATIRIINTKRLFPSFLLRIKVLEKTVTSSLVRRCKSETNSFVHVFPERGTLTIPYGEICSPFPINFFVRCRRTALHQQKLVFPAPLGCAVADDSGTHRESGVSLSALKGYEGDLARIADYTGSEPMKMIHWRLSAKYDELKVKEMNATSREPVIIDLNSLHGRDLEEKLSCAVYLINRLIGRNQPVGLKLQDRVISPKITREHRLRLLSELAVYGKD
jgi:uncharacterized protein (DUF58 family)